MIKPVPVTLDMDVEKLVAAFPEIVGFLARRDIRCIRCGEPVWKTLGTLLRENGVESPQLLVDEINEFLFKE